jgi:hypothetical protein
MTTTTTTPNIDKLSAQLSATEGKLADADERTLPRLNAQRDKPILALIEAGAGYAHISRIRGAPASTNRGLIRVLQGGKRI